MIVFRVHMRNDFFSGVYHSNTAEVFLHDMQDRHPPPPSNWLAKYGQQGLFAFPSMEALHTWIFPEAMVSLIKEGGFVLSVVNITDYMNNSQQLIFDCDNCTFIGAIELTDIADEQGFPK